MNVYKENVPIHKAYFALACSRLSVSGDGRLTFEVWERKGKTTFQSYPVTDSLEQGNFSLNFTNLRLPSRARGRSSKFFPNSLIILNVIIQPMLGTPILSRACGLKPRWNTGMTRYLWLSCSIKPLSLMKYQALLYKSQWHSEW